MATPDSLSRHERLSPGACALLGFLQPDVGRAVAARVWDLPPQEWGETLELALRHGVAPLLHRALQLGAALDRLPEYVRTSLEEERCATALENLRRLGQFRCIASALREQGISVIALKGLHLAELVYRDISLRPMSDLDILVPRAQVQHAVTILLTLEYKLIGGLSSGYDIGLTHRDTGMLVEIHWALDASTELPTSLMDDIWQFAVGARIGDADAQVMSPEFLLLHVCEHLAYHHLFALDFRALCDIAEIVRACPALDWAVVVDQCWRRGHGRGVAVALRLARDQLGAAVPAEVLAAMGDERLNAQRLDDALEQLATSAGFSAELRSAPKLMALAGAASAGEKIVAVLKRIFVPRTELGLIYDVPERSARIYLYYIVRMWDLVSRYAARAWELNVSGTQLAATAARHARLEKWIREV
jgi:hypothetical protein